MSLLFALVAASASHAASPVPARMAPELTRCDGEGLDANARCGIVRVPEDRTKSHGRLLPIHFVVLPATGRTTDDPLVVLPGGPGAGGAESAAGIAQLFAPLRKSRDLLLIDQRGTGSSNPLNCPDNSSEERPLRAVAGADVANTIACRNVLAKKADLRLYFTREAVLDMEQVRKSLGYDRLDLFGQSYGTRIALDYVRLFPDRVGQTVIRGAAPVDMRLPFTSPKDVQRSFDRLAELCKSQQPCHDHYDLQKDLRRILARLNRRAAPITLKDPQTGKVTTGKLDRLGFGTVIFSMLYIPRFYVQLPPLLHQAAESGNFSPLAQAAAPFILGANEGLAWGMYNSVICDEDVRRIPRTKISAASKGTLTGRLPIDDSIKSCSVWPVANIPKDYLEPVRTTKPVLIISGEFDPVAGDNWGAHVAATLPNSLHLVVPGASHLPPLNKCTADIVSNLYDGSALQKLDTSCVARVERPSLKVAAP